MTKKMGSGTNPTGSFGPESSLLSSGSLTRRTSRACDRRASVDQKFVVARFGKKSVFATFCRECIGEIEICPDSAAMFLGEANAMLAASLREFVLFS